MSLPLPQFSLSRKIRRLQWSVCLITYLVPRHLFLLPHCHCVKSTNALCKVTEAFETQEPAWPEESEAYAH